MSYTTKQLIRKVRTAGTVLFGASTIYIFPFGNAIRGYGGRKADRKRNEVTQMNERNLDE